MYKRQDYEDAGEEWIVWTTANEVMAVSKALEEQGVQVKGSETTMVPTTPTEVSGADAKKVQRLIDRLEELDDVQDVYSTCLLYTSTPNQDHHKGDRHLCGGLLGNDDRTATFPQIKPAKINPVSYTHLA